MLSTASRRYGAALYTVISTEIRGDLSMDITSESPLRGEQRPAHLLIKRRGRLKSRSRESLDSVVQRHGLLIIRRRTHLDRRGKAQRIATDLSNPFCDAAQLRGLR